MAGEFAYFDTSALVKRYVKEDGSPRARALLRRHRFVSSSIAPVEAISAFSRRRATGDLTERDFVAMLARLREDRAYWDLIEVSSMVLGRAEELVRREALRTLDAVHVASALTFEMAHGVRLPFVTADARQRDAAGRLALAIVWVGS